jgi:predicted metalloprotease with PDZ domain
MRLIPVSVGGNPFAQPEELQEAIREKAAEMGANRVFLDPRVAERPFVTAGREGGRLLKRESDPQLSGLVCRALPVHLGFQVGSGWRVEYVFPASQAEAAGLKVGDQIMILNDRHDPSDPAAWDRVFAKGKVGDRMDIVFLDRKGDLQRRFLELLPVECIRAGAPAGAC